MSSSFKDIDFKMSVISVEKLKEELKQVQYKSNFL